MTDEQSVSQSEEYDRGAAMLNGYVALSNAVYVLLAAHAGVYGQPWELDASVVNPYVDAHPELAAEIYKVVDQVLSEWGMAAPAMAPPQALGDVRQD